MNLRFTQRILMTNFLFMVVLALLLVALYECEILEPTDMASDVSLMFVLQIVMELLTIVVIPVALKMFSIKVIRKKLIADKGNALLPWGTARINMLCLPMLVNVFLYYQTMSPAFGYMAIILFLCLFFIYPSIGRCTAETEAEENEKRRG